MEGITCICVCVRSFVSERKRLSLRAAVFVFALVNSYIEASLLDETLNRGTRRFS